MNRNKWLAVVWVLVWAAAVRPAAAQDSLVSARQLYGSAAYDEALSMLDRLKAAPPSAAEGLALDEYRAFCLMALGRQAEAVVAVEAIVTANPSFAPNEAEVSPRVVATFRDARRRLLPAIAQHRYQAARANYDKKEYAAALAGFDETLRLLDVPDLAEAAQQPPLSDLRTLIVGFRDLAKVAATPPPPPKPEPKPVAAPPPPPPKAFYTSDDAGVVAPVAINQRVPRWPANSPAFMPKGRRGVLEVMISAQGTVESAIIRESIAPLYDDMLVSEAKNWRYKPATKDNLPVKFKKMIQFTMD
jgi:TonB family protein